MLVSGRVPWGTMEKIIKQKTPAEEMIYTADADGWTKPHLSIKNNWPFKKSKEQPMLFF